MLAARVLYRRGPRHFDEYRFATKPIARWREFITDAERVALQASTAPVAARVYEEDKLQFAAHCAQCGLPHVPIVAIVSRHISNSPLSVPIISTAEQLARCFVELGDFDGFAKPIASGKGLGVLPFQIRSGRLMPTPDVPTTEALFQLFTESKLPGNGYLLQPLVRVHSALRPVMPGLGVGAVRVVTFLRATTVHVALAVLKVPAPNAPCDDERLGAQLAEVALATGRLEDAVGTTIESGVTQVVTHHRETGQRFRDTVLPFWPETLALVNRAARAFPMLPALGWDVVITEDGPLLLEANWRFSAVFFEQCRDRGWADELRALYASTAVPAPVEPRSA